MTWLLLTRLAARDFDRGRDLADASQMYVYVRQGSSLSDSGRLGLAVATGLVLFVGCAAHSPRRAAVDQTAAQPRRGDQIEDLLQAAARRHSVDPALIRGVIYVESRFRVDARSGVGARGLMQLMPTTAATLARDLGWDSYDIVDPEFNIEAGTYYLAKLLERFDGSKSLALAAYHTGPTRVAGWVRRNRPLPSYSRRYVRDVLAAARRLAAGRPTPVEVAAPDREALRALLRDRLYGPREGARSDARQIDPKL
jgi:hypothetical protein